MKTVLKAAKIVCLDSADSILTDGYILLEDDRIVAIGDASSVPDADDTINLGNRLIMPGLINAHTHSPMSLFRGMVEGHTLFDFDGWYNTIRVVEEVMTPDMLPAAVSVSCAEMIRTGTTTFADQYFWMDQIVPAVRASGMRAALGYGVVELGDATARDREIAAVRHFLQSLQDDPLLTGWVGPHAFFVDNSLEAIELELQLADEFETGLHIHLSTSGEEDRWCQQHFGRTAVQQMSHMGILDRRLLAAHCLTVPPEDYATLADSNFTAVVAASSAMRNAAGVADLPGMLAAGINVALGSDNVTNNNSYDLFQEMQIVGKLMALTYKTPNAVATRDILHMATLGGAQALGMADDIGSLEVGKKADLIALDLDEIGWTPSGSQDIYTALVYAVGGMHVRDTMVDGRCLYRDGEWQTVDYKAQRTTLEQTNKELQSRVIRDA